MSVAAGAAGRALKNVSLEKAPGQASSARALKSFAIRGLPTTATAADVLRSIRPRLKELGGVAGAALQYNRYQPVGRAVVKLNNADSLPGAVTKIHGSYMLGVRVKAVPLDRNDEARESKMPGTGIRGTSPHGRRSVVIWGLPGRLQPAQLELALEGFDILRDERGEARILKVPLPEKTFSLFSRFRLTMTSADEAHRLVRSLHMTHWDRDRNIRIYARVID